MNSQAMYRGYKLGLICQIELQLRDALNDHAMVKRTQGQGHVSLHV